MFKACSAPSSPMMGRTLWGTSFESLDSLTKNCYHHFTDGETEAQAVDRPPGGHSIHRHVRQKSPEVHDRPLGGIYFGLGSQHMYPFIYWFSKDTWWTHQILLIRVCKSESQAHTSTQASTFSLWDSQRLGYGLLWDSPATSPFSFPAKCLAVGHRK